MGAQSTATFKGACHCGGVEFEAPDHYGVNVYCLDGIDLSGVPVRRVDGKTMSVVAG